MHARGDTPYLPHTPTHRDRFRTMVNVWGDSVGAGVVEKLSHDYLVNNPIDPVEMEVTANGKVKHNKNGQINNGYMDQRHSDDETSSYL